MKSSGSAIAIAESVVDLTKLRDTVTAEHGKQSRKSSISTSASCAITR